MASGSAGPSRKLGPDLETDDNSSNDDFLEDPATKRQRLQITQGPDAPEQTVLLKKRGRRSWNTLHSVNVSNDTDFRSQLLQIARRDFMASGTEEPPGILFMCLVAYFLSQFTNHYTSLYVCCRHDHGICTARRFCASIQFGAMV